MACLMLTISLITLIFYFHPSTTTRRCTSGPSRSSPNDRARGGGACRFQHARDKDDVIFKLDSTRQEAAAGDRTTQDRRGGCGAGAARVDMLKADGHRGGEERISTGSGRAGREARTATAQSGIVPQRDIEKLAGRCENGTGRQRGCGNADRQSAVVRVMSTLPAEKASAEAALDQAQVDLDKTYIRAGVDGRVEQFLLRVRRYRQPDDTIGGNPDPGGCRKRSLQAGFGQIEAQVLKAGMVAEAACNSCPGPLFRW